MAGVEKLRDEIRTSVLRLVAEVCLRDHIASQRLGLGGTDSRFLTLLDLQQLGEVGIGHITARQELREMIAGLGIAQEEQKLAAVG